MSENINNPLVSVIIPTYNKHKLVFYALTPALSQRERENKENQFCLGI